MTPILTTLAGTVMSVAVVPMLVELAKKYLPMIRLSDDQGKLARALASVLGVVASLLLAVTNHTTFDVAGAIQVLGQAFVIFVGATGVYHDAIKPASPSLGLK